LGHIANKKAGASVCKLARAYLWFAESIVCSVRRRRDFRNLASELKPAAKVVADGWIFLSPPKSGSNKFDNDFGRWL
jgi:hypothetical protein